MHIDIQKTSTEHDEDRNSFSSTSNSAVQNVLQRKMDQENNVNDETEFIVVSKP